jgi:hypothetical protein
MIYILCKNKKLSSAYPKNVLKAIYWGLVGEIDFVLILLKLLIYEIVYCYSELMEL